MKCLINICGCHEEMINLLCSRSSWNCINSSGHLLENNNTAAAKSLQSCPTLCDPRDGSPPGSPVPGILQARTLEWVAISFSNAWRGKVKGKLLSRVRLFVTPWTAVHQAPLSMGFSRQEYWSGLPLPSPRISTIQKVRVNVCVCVCVCVCPCACTWVQVHSLFISNFSDTQKK